MIDIPEFLQPFLVLCLTDETEMSSTFKGLDTVSVVLHVKSDFRMKQSKQLQADQPKGHE